MAKINNETHVEFIETTSTKLENVQATHPGAFIHVNDLNGDDVLYIGEDKVTDKFNVGDENLNSPTRKVGGLNASTIGVLKEKSVSELLLEILREDVIEPTCISINEVIITYDGNKLIEVGTVLPNKIDITSLINDGIWSDGTPYAGMHTDPKLSNMWVTGVWHGGDIWVGDSYWDDLTYIDTEFGIPSKEGVYRISGIVDFAQGGIPHDNYHNAYPEKQYTGGSLQSNIIEIISVYPIYINNGDNIKFIQKQPLVDYLTSVVELEDIDIQNEIDGTLDKFSIYLPGYFNTFEVKQFNPLTNQYDIDINMIPISENYITDNDKTSDIKYIKYIRSDDIYDTVGYSKYKIKLKKYVKDI